MENNFKKIRKSLKNIKRKMKGKFEENLSVFQKNLRKILEKFGENEENFLTI